MTAEAWIALATLGVILLGMMGKGLLMLGGVRRDIARIVPLVDDHHDAITELRAVTGLPASRRPRPRTAGH